MSAPLLVIKLCIIPYWLDTSTPLRTRSVLLPRLVEPLNAGTRLGRNLTAICTSAGFGIPEPHLQSVVLAAADADERALRVNAFNP
jgi:hypothetical protein